MRRGERRCENDDKKSNRTINERPERGRGGYGNRKKNK
jgi:hypothetical protein